MTSRQIGIGAALLLIAAAAVWAARRGSDEAGGKRTQTTNGGQPALAHAGPTGAEEPVALQTSRPAAAPAPTASRPVAPHAKGPDPRDLELVNKLFLAPGPRAPEADRVAWESSPISDLLYPGDHPCAGRPRDSVSEPVLTGAAEEALEEMLLPLTTAVDPQLPPAIQLDRPQCHLQGNWPFFPLNNCARGLNQEDPESVARFRACLAEIGEDPKAYPASLWVPCPSGDPEATTPREYYRRMLAARVHEIYAQPPCRAD